MRLVLQSDSELSYFIGKYFNTCKDRCVTENATGNLARSWYLRKYQ